MRTLGAGENLWVRAPGKNLAVGTGKGFLNIGKGLGGEFKKSGGKSKGYRKKD